MSAIAPGCALPTAWRPKIVFWLSRAEPHFLVKHVGKRGPFTDTFETVLTAVGTPDGGGRPSEHPRRGSRSSGASPLPSASLSATTSWGN